MKQDELKKFIVTEPLSVVDAMKQMDDNGRGILFIVDSNGVLCGTLSDGDIRRWIIKTGDLKSDIHMVMNRSPRYLYKNHGLDIYKYMLEQRITAVPIVDTDKRIIDIGTEISCNKDVSEIRQHSIEGIPVIIMAGGKGTRLYPYTKILPKPLIPIGEIPILQRILDRFYLYGADEFFLTINYRKEMIKAFFADLDLDYTINFVEENKPLGTAGAIKLIDRQFDTPVIVSNCDILIGADYGEILRFHMESGNAMTIVSSLKNIAIPYGVLQSQESGLITSIEEKPIVSCLVNTGMYVVDAMYFKKIPKDIPFHMTQLAEQMICDGEKVGMYPIGEKSFLDMGEFSEMKKMEDSINNNGFQ